MHKKQDVHRTEEEIDLAPLLEDCLGQLDMLEDLLSLYKQNALEFMGTVKHCLEIEDFDGISFAAHKIKGGLKLLRTEALVSMAEQIHHHSKTSRNPAALYHWYQAFLVEYPRVEAGLDKALEQLRKN